MNKKAIFTIIFLVIVSGWIILARTYLTCQTFYEFNKVNPHLCRNITRIIDFLYQWNH